MKIKAVSVKQGISAIGFRKIVSIIREYYPSTEIYFIPLAEGLLIGKEETGYFSDNDVENIAENLKDTDILLFSSMTIGAKYIEKISIRVKEKNPKIYIAWGGIHPTLMPEEAILYADAICIGEGEKVILDIIKERPRGLINGPLLSSDELSKAPYAYNDYDCLVYKDRAFKQLDKYDYVKYHGLLYRSIWVRGCPYSCSYCANSSLAKITKEYHKSRHASVDHIINETKEALKKYDFITTVNFDDDTFIALSVSTIKEFCEKYKKEIGLPFAITGTHPNLVTEEKIKLLIEAGMIRVRMGIQSGSKDTLKFYNRPTSVEKITESSNLLIRLCRQYKIVPPIYDIITDSPVESLEEQFKTLKLVNGLDRPFLLTLFSLRVMRKTKLADIFGYDDQENSPLEAKPTLINILFYLVSIIRFPTWLLNALYGKLTKEFPITAKIVKRFFLFYISATYILHSDFSKMSGRHVLFFRRKHLPR